MSRFAFVAALLAAMPLFADPAAAEVEGMELEEFLSSSESVLSGEYSAADVLAASRAMLPDRPMELTGAIVRRSRKGFTKQECDWRLTLNRGVEPAILTVAFYKRGEMDLWRNQGGDIERLPKPIVETSLTRPGEVPSGHIMETDVTWWDLTLDFLWWQDPRFEAEREGESVHGQKCAVILVTPPEKVEGISAVRLWAEKKTGALMQAEAIGDDGNPIRRLWGTRIRKFGERWMANILEVETIGTHHRTKIIVNSLREI